MEKGDLSNEIVPRMYIVYEGLIASPASAADKASAAVALRLHRWKKALSYFETNELVVQHIWDAVWRKNFSVDVVTFLGDGFAEAVEKRLEREDLPIGRVHSTQPNMLARECVYRPHILAVYDPDPSHVFTYGGKGRIVSPDAPNLFGT